MFAAKETKEVIDCKYCMCSEAENGDFLMSPCKCAGSCSVVHFNCLKEWNKAKLEKNSAPGVTIYTMNDFHCEVCKAPYPHYIMHKEEMK